jgi:hypothetical protein
MNFDEWKKLVKGMKSIWTRDDFLPDSYSVQIWYEMLKDLSYSDLNMAIQLHATKSKWSPSISELRELATTSALDLKDWSEGWEQVVKAIGSYGYNREKDALASMDDTTATVVKRLGWKQICQSNQDELMAIRANFRMIYEQVNAKTKETAMLSDGAKRQIASRQQALLSEKLEGVFS